MLKVTENELSTARKLLAVGQYTVESGQDERVWAAFMQVVHTIYNLEEAITKS